MVDFGWVAFFFAAWLLLCVEEKVTMNRITGNEKRKSGEKLLTRGLCILIDWKVCLLVRKRMFGFRLVAIDERLLYGNEIG
jgi:hypothetical protein